MRNTGRTGVPINHDGQLLRSILAFELGGVKMVDRGSDGDGFQWTVVDGLQQKNGEDETRFGDRAG